MIRPLRNRHRITVCALGVLLPSAFVAGVAARRPVPVVASVSSELAIPAKEFGKVVWSKVDVWPGKRIITSLRRNAEGSVALELMFRDIVKPDVLVYWVAGRDNTTTNLPDNARLLGALANRAPLPIPEDIRGNPGRFLLYSLADHEIVALSNPFTIQRFNGSTF